MINQKIIELTLEQEALIPVYKEKWRKIAFNSAPINKEKAQQAIYKAYELIGYDPPHEVIFVSSPYAANRWIIQQSESLSKTLLANNALDYSYNNYLFSNFFQQERLLAALLDIKLSNKENLANFLSLYQKHKLNVEIEQDFRNQGRIYRAGLEQIKQDLYHSLINLEEVKKKEIFACILDNIKSEELASDACELDFAISVLNYYPQEKTWEILQELIANCGWIYPFEKTCIVCDRPTQLRFDQENRSHGEGVAALEFADGFSLYSYHGVILPEKYGKLHPHQWESRWLLEETNAELRRVLIQGIGYARLCQELEAVELDSWREYTLLLIKHNLDLEPIYLLKMSCPSTGHIHALRVPPEVTTARVAIRWANWGIDPEEFSIST